MGKQAYYEIRYRTVLQMIGDYDSGVIMMKHFDYMAANPVSPAWEFNSGAPKP